ncbi:MAG TPA: arginine repressor [Syntrophomonas sp.]|jgi:transcriptional regulator of arginine metabolism|nr:arginine repressor [Syntrophomonas sp.]HCF71782.1 arginine repressor [Syntrophomonas sp.]
MKSRRHFAIREILAKEHITTQEELCEALRNIGYDVTQATVSRDIKELHLVKVPDQNGYRYSLPENNLTLTSRERFQRLFRDSVINIDYCENLIVIKTLPGAAQSVASLIDSSNFPDIMGTVAGDDTLFSAVKSREAVIDVVTMFRELLR